MFGFGDYWNIRTNTILFLNQMSKRNRIIYSDDEEEEDGQIDNGKKNKEKDVNIEEEGDCELDNLLIEEEDSPNIDHSLSANLRINTKSQSRSSHPIWDSFGKLEKDGKTMVKAKDRIFCVHCFQKKKMKR